MKLKMNRNTGFKLVLDETNKFHLRQISIRIKNHVEIKRSLDLKKLKSSERFILFNFKITDKVTNMRF